MKKSLIERAMVYKEYVGFRYCQKKKKKTQKIKESDDSLIRNYWNKTKYIWLNNREI